MKPKTDKDRMKMIMDSMDENGKRTSDPDQGSITEDIPDAEMEEIPSDPDEESIDDPMIKRPSIFKNKGVHIFIKAK